MTEFRTVCPHCGAVHDRATDLTKPDAVAKPGDVSVCIKCAGVLVFTDARGTVRAGAVDEFSGAQGQALRHLVGVVRLALQEAGRTAPN